jgi:membrane-associated phospholipid phosphatase
MWTLSLVFAGLYTLSWLALWDAGLSPAFPGSFLTLLLLVAVPFGYGVFWVLRAVPARVPPAVGLLSAVPVLLLYQLDHRVVQACCLAFTIFVAWHLWRHRPVPVATLIPAMLVVILGYLTVWNANYLVLRWALPRLQDPWLQQIDLAIYGGYREVFPLLTQRWAIRLLENAYLIVFAEIALLLFLLAADETQLRRFLLTLFACYAVGLLAFAVFPAVGPPLYYPDSFRTDAQQTLTYRVMQAMANEYQAVRQSTALSGTGYFVALPSLHVAVAALLQLFLARHRLFYWTFLPINTLTCLSTVVLGYHYLVDLPAGLALAGAVYLVQARRNRVPSLSATRI